MVRLRPRVRFPPNRLPFVFSVSFVVHPLAGRIVSHRGDVQQSLDGIAQDVRVHNARLALDIIAGR